MMRLFGVFGGHEAAAAVCFIIISSLSVCAAFLIYRAVKGQREKSNGENHVYQPKNETAVEEEDDWSRSTESDTGCPKDCESDSGDAAKHLQTPSHLPEKDKRRSTHETLYISAEHPSRQNDVPDEKYLKCKKVVSDDVNIDVLGSHLLDHHYQSNTPEKDVNGNSMRENTHITEDFGTDQHVDMDESSETESAQENVPVYKCQSVEDLSDNTFSTQEAVIKNSHKGESILSKPVFTTDTTGLQAQQKPTMMDDMKIKIKAFGTGMEHSSQMNDFDSCCNDKKSDLLSCNLASKAAVCKDKVQDLTTSNTDKQHLSKKYDHQFDSPLQSHQVPVSPELQGDSTAPPQLLDVSKGTADATVVESQNKNVISIMEAIMDNNEWLSTGSADTKDLPWLAQSQGNTRYGSKAEADKSSSSAPAKNSFEGIADDELTHQEKIGVSIVSPVDNIVGVAGSKADKSSSPAPAKISCEGNADDKLSQQEETEVLMVSPVDTIIGVTRSKADKSSSPAPAKNSFKGNANDELSHQEKMGVSMVSLVDTIIGVTSDEYVTTTVSTMLPVPQLVHVSFRVHYITNSPTQILAVTGNQRELGDWESFVPLKSVEDGFWFCNIKLPIDIKVEWKFVMVEEGKIRRWEECANRYLVLTKQEKEIYLNKNWGYA